MRSRGSRSLRMHGIDGSEMEVRVRRGSLRLHQKRQRHCQDTVPAVRGVVIHTPCYGGKGVLLPYYCVKS